MADVLQASLDMPAGQPFAIGQAAVTMHTVLPKQGGALVTATTPHATVLESPSKSCCLVCLWQCRLQLVDFMDRPLNSLFPVKTGERTHGVRFP